MPKRTRKKIPDAIFSLLLSNNKDKSCAWCGLPLDEMDTEVDHIIPFSMGGSDSINNLQLLHKSCNREKSNNI